MKRKGTRPTTANAVRPVETCILAGGLSSRMGREKAGLRLGRRTLLAHVRAAAKECGFPTRVIRRDRVARCGPLGGVFTAVATARAEVVLLLSCDMPFVSAGLLRRLIRRFSRRKNALFIERNRLVGFPFLVRCGSLPVIEQQLAKRELSLQKLARALKAETLRPLRREAMELLNINTPVDFARAVKYFGERLNRGRVAMRPSLAAGRRSRAQKSETSGIAGGVQE